MKTRVYWGTGMILVWAALPSLHSANGTWSGATGDWTDSANWQAGTIPGATSGTTSTDIATFGGVGSGGTITVDAYRNVGGITFGTQNYSLSGGLLVLTGGASAITGGSGSLSISSNIQLEAASTFTGSGTGGGVQISGGLAGNAATSSNYTLTLTGTNLGNKISGVISDGIAGGTLSLTSGNIGVWELSTANTYSGGTIINGTASSTTGGLLVTHANALGTGDVTINTANSGANSRSGTLQLAGDIALAGPAQIILATGGRPQGGKAQIENLSGNNSYAGNVVGASIDMILGSVSGKLTLSGTVSNTNSTGTAGSARTLILQGAGAGEISGKLERSDSTRPLAINKTGSGTWTFSNAGTGTNRNNYKGATTVTAGTLLINTDNSLATGAITVNSAATYGGNGISGGAATFAAGSFLSPGAEAGVAGSKTFNSTVDLSGLTGGTDGGLVFQLGTSSDEVILSSGVLTLGSLDLSDFNFTALTGFGEGTYVLFDTTQTINGSLGSLLTGTLAGYNIELAFAPGSQDVVLNVTAVPEPSTYALFALGFGGLWLLRRRKP